MEIDPRVCESPQTRSEMFCDEWKRALKLLYKELSSVLLVTAYVGHLVVVALHLSFRGRGTIVHKKTKQIYSGVVIRKFAVA